MKRQRKWIPDSEIYHLWAHQAQSEGQTRVCDLGGINGPCMGRGSRASFRGPVFYSYSTAIARLGKRKGEEYVILNVTKYSNMTSGHLQSVRQASSHIKHQFSVDDQGYGVDLSFTPKELVSYYREKGEAKAKETHKQKRMMYGILWSAVHWYEKAIEAAEFFGLGTNKLEARKVKLLHECEQYKEAHDKYEEGSEARRESRDAARRERQRRWDAQQAHHHRSHVLEFINDPKENSPPYHGHVLPELMDQYAAACKVREDWLMEQNRAKLEEWMNGDSDFFHGLHDLPVRLRATNEGAGLAGPRDIETSHGAVIPYADGLRCYRFCSRLWRRDEAWHRNGEQFEVGPYKLESVNRQGIVAGCHRISREEIERFAQQEGWVQLNEEKDESETKVEAVS